MKQSCHATVVMFSLIATEVWSIVVGFELMEFPAKKDLYSDYYESGIFMRDYCSGIVMAYGFSS